MSAKFEVLVVGAGPAGLAAARIIAAAGISCAVVDKMGPGGQLMNMGEVHDFPGVQAGTTGPDLITQLLDATLAAGAEVMIDEVRSAKHQALWAITMLDQEVKAKALVVATGLADGSLGLESESEFEGQGISHCAVCDGPLYAGKPVVVAGSNRWAVQEAIDLLAVASHVTLVSDTPELQATAPQLQALTSASSFQQLTGRVASLGGAGSLDHVTVETADGKRTVRAAGVFVSTNRRPATAFLPATAPVAADRAVVTDPNGGTVAPGLFACGDARMGAMHTIAAAIADGERTGHNVLRWLEQSTSG